MSTKHTPGPWTVVGKDSQFVYKLNVKGCNQFLCRLDGVNTPTPELEANARLIAAAPELLEACLAVLSGEKPYITKCRDAISKATGDQE